MLKLAALLRKGSTENTAGGSSVANPGRRAQTLPRLSKVHSTNSHFVSRTFEHSLELFFSPLFTKNVPSNGSDIHYRPGLVRPKMPGASWTKLSRHIASHMCDESQVSVNYGRANSVNLISSLSEEDNPSRSFYKWSSALVGKITQWNFIGAKSVEKRAPAYMSYFFYVFYFLWTFEVNACFAVFGRSPDTLSGAEMSCTGTSVASS